MEKLQIAIVSCLLGVFIGHRFQLGRDKRKEYNELIFPLKQRVNDHVDEISNKAMIFNPIKQDELRKVRLFLKASQYEKLVSCHEIYDQKRRKLGKMSDALGRTRRKYSESDCLEIINVLKKMDNILPLK